MLLKLYSTSFPTLQSHELGIKIAKLEWTEPSASTNTTLGLAWTMRYVHTLL